VFGETGIVLSVIRPLSENGLGVFVISTFNGDYLLLKQQEAETARVLLLGAGQEVVSPTADCEAFDATLKLGPPSIIGSVAQSNVTIDVVLDRARELRRMEGS